MASVKPPSCQFYNNEVRMGITLSWWLLFQLGMSVLFGSPLQLLLPVMPCCSYRNELLDQLAQHQQESYDFYLSSLLTDLPSDAEHASSDTMSISITSEISSVSSMDTSSDSEHSTTSSNSQTLSEIAADCFYSWQEQLQELVHKISTTRVLNEHAPLQKTSQLHLLDVWRNTRYGALMWPLVM